MTGKPDPAGARVAETMRAQIRRLFRFGIVGVAATVIYVATLTALVELLGADPRVANVVGFLFAVPVSYLGNYYWSFGSDHPHRSTVLRFAMVAGTAFLTSQGLMLLALDVLSLHYGIGVLLVVIVMPLVSFAMQQALVFRRRGDLATSRKGAR